jgi:hypothetical protein
MSAGGALVAIMAAAHARRLQDVTDAFRLGDATAPERARSLEALGVAHAAEAAELADAGVLVPGRAAGTWYLSEAAVVARRRSKGGAPRRVLVVILILTAVMAVAAGVLLASRRS